MKDTITHKGTVVQSGRGTVDVLMRPESACGACHARKVCGMEEGEERILNVVTINAHTYREGEEVNVSISEGMGIKAALIAYAYPFLLVFVLLIALLQSGISELVAGLSGLGVLAAYYVVLYRFRNRIAKEIQLSISKIEQDNGIEE